MLSPDHIKSILTSKEYASEAKFVAVARAMNKVQKLEDKELYENPYKAKDRRGRPSLQGLCFNEEVKIRDGDAITHDRSDILIDIKKTEF